MPTMLILPGPNWEEDTIDDDSLSQRYMPAKLTTSLADITSRTCGDTEPDFNRLSKPVCSIEQIL